MSRDGDDARGESGGDVESIVGQTRRLATLAAADRIADLIRELRSPQARGEAASMLGSLRERSAVPELIRLVRSSDGADRVAAITALGRIRDRAALEELREQLRSGTRDRDRVWATLLALGKLGDPVAVPDMLAHVDSKEDRLGHAALVSLVLIGEEPSASRARELIQALPRSRRRKAERLLEWTRLEIEEESERRAYARNYYARRTGMGWAGTLWKRPPDVPPQAWRIGRVVIFGFVGLVALVVAPLWLVDRSLKRMRSVIRRS